MRVYELLIQQICATNGTFVVSSSAKVDAIVSGSSPTETVDFEDPSGNGVCPFVAGDIVLCQRVDVVNPSTLIRRYVRKVSSVSGRRVVFVAATGGPADTGGAMRKGDDFVRIGSESNSARRGLIYLTSDDANAPYIQIADGVSALS